MRLILGLISLWTFSLHAGLTVNCGADMANGFPYRWCISTSPGSTNPDVLYYLHGGGGDEHVWENWTSLQDEWVKQGVAAPTVIAFSFGHQWLLGDMITADHPALLPLVQNIIMPKLEAKIGGVRGQRMLAGHSMGGYNSAELALRSPGVFSRVALLCPGIMILKPFLSAADIDQFMRTHPVGVVRANVEGIMHWAERDFGTLANWNRHDPLELVKSVRGTQTSFYLSCSKDDDYGFYNGSEKFAQILNTNGVPAQFVSIARGGHCAETMQSLQSLGQFLGQTAP